MLTISNGKYQIKNEWCELTLADCIELEKIEVPKCLQSFYTDPTKEPPVFTIEEQVKIIPLYYIEVLSKLSNIPKETFDYTAVVDIVELFKTIEPIVISIFDNIAINYDDKIIEREYFDFENERYYLPKSLRIKDDVITMADEPVITFIEGADLQLLSKELETKDISKLANLVSFYCRKKGEVYDSDKMLLRAESFTLLTMDIVWEVFFCLSKLIIEYQSRIQMFLEKAQQQIVKEAMAD